MIALGNLLTLFEASIAFLPSLTTLTFSSASGSDSLAFALKLVVDVTCVNLGSAMIFLSFLDIYLDVEVF